MKKFGKVLSLVLAAALALSCNMVSVSAEEEGQRVCLGSCTEAYYLNVTEIGEAAARLKAQEMIDDGLITVDSAFLYDYDETEEVYHAVKFKSNAIYPSTETCSLSEIWLSGYYENTYFIGTLGDKIEKPEGYKFETITSVQDLSKISTEGASLTKDEIIALGFGSDAYILVSSFITPPGGGEKLYMGLYYGEVLEAGLFEFEVQEYLDDETPIAILVEEEKPQENAPNTGDTANAGLYILISVLALAAVFGTFSVMRKREG